MYELRSENATKHFYPKGLYVNFFHEAKLKYFCTAKENSDF